MHLIKMFFINLKRFIFFWFGLFFCVKLGATASNKKPRLIFTPLRGCDNCWVDYYLAIRFANLADVEVLMMTPNAIPFGNAENYTSRQARLYCTIQCIKHVLIQYALKLRSVKYTVIDSLPNSLRQNNDSVHSCIDEFFRRFYGDRNYQTHIDGKKYADVSNLFFSLSEYVSKNYKATDILVSSHGIYEWGVCYRVFRQMAGKTLIWGANIYNSQVLRVSDQPLQVGTPLGSIYDNCLIDLTSRFSGLAIDQPKHWNQNLISDIPSFINKFRRVALLAPNCLWDGDSDIRDSMFKGVLDWVRDTLQFAENNSSLGVIIRVHPAEAELWRSRPSLWKVLNAIRLPKNCLLISPHAGYSTLEISSLSDVTVFYSGMAGIEASALGHNVLCVSSSIHGKMAGIRQLYTIDEYHKALVEDAEDANISTDIELSIDDLFNRGVLIANHPGSTVTMFTNPNFKGYIAQGELDAFFQSYIEVS